MKLLNVETLTPKHIEFINAQNVEGRGLREIIRDEMKAKSVNQKVRGEIKKVKNKLEEMGYISVDGFYKLEEKDEVVVEEYKDEVQQKDEESKPKRTYLTKKQKAELEDQKRKEFEEMLKENPFQLVYTYDLLSQVDRVATQMVEEEVKPLGVYTIPEVEKALEELQKRFYYIPAYLLISASISFTCEYLDYFAKSKWGNEFIENAFKVEKNRRDFRRKETLRMIEFVQQKLEQIDLESEEGINSRKHLRELKEDLNSQKKRKQTNVKTSRFVAETALALVQDKFPFLSKSDVVNLCIYSFSKCMIINLKSSNND